MPLLAAGDQGWSAELMLRSILDAATHWLARGLPIRELKIVAPSPECREELMQARLRNKRSSALLFPVYWLDWGKELDLWLQIVNYADCREGDHRTLAGTMAKLSLA